MCGTTHHKSKYINKDYKLSYLLYSFLDRYTFITAWKVRLNLELLNSPEMEVQGDPAPRPRPALLFPQVPASPGTCVQACVSEPSATARTPKLLLRNSPHTPDAASGLLLRPKGVRFCSVSREEICAGPRGGFKAIWAENVGVQQMQSVV